MGILKEWFYFIISLISAIVWGRFNYKYFVIDKGAEKEEIYITLALLGMFLITFIVVLEEAKILLF